MPNPTCLPYRRYGKGGTPLVLIHGFGADRLTWSSLAKALSEHRQVIALDLPGHGEAVDWEGTPDASVCAKAVVASLDALGIARATLVGHSLGGAVASLTALRQPERVERLILLAPGGFGAEMNVDLLRRYAAIITIDEARAVLPAFFGSDSEMPSSLPRQTAEQRQKPGVAEKLRAIVEVIAKGEGQGRLPLADLMDLGVPMSLIWGHEDAVLPVAQAIDAPPEIARHLVTGVGHMPHLEVPDLVLRIIRDADGVPRRGG